MVVVVAEESSAIFLDFQSAAFRWSATGGESAATTRVQRDDPATRRVSTK